MNEMKDLNVERLKSGFLIAEFNNFPKGCQAAVKVTARIIGIYDV